MNIDRTILDKIAHLARLQVPEQDADKLMHEMTAILNWVEKLNELDTRGVEPLTSMSHEVNAFREDEIIKNLSQEEALKPAPKHDGIFFNVPKVIE
jgi:aspartyl-tRNA(Asn)/glutamyl-tRNA(Gln) amidotransferase subunit C